MTAAAAATIFGLCVLTYAGAAKAGTISPELERSMARRGTHADTAVIVRLTNALDMEPFAVSDRRLRDSRLLSALKARASLNRAALNPMLVSLGAEHIKDLWIVNALAVTVPAVEVKVLAGHPNVDRIEPDTFVQSGRSQRTPRSRSEPASRTAVAVAPVFPAVVAQALPLTPVDSAKVGWNIKNVRAPDVWGLGHTGKGVTVATMDTGVDMSHPDLANKWRGGNGGWFDPHGEEASPYDASGHGTQAMGVMVGGAEIAVAPNANWIAVRMYNAEGRTSMSDIHRAFQWLLDPDGDVSTQDAPDVVNASWALTGRAVGACVNEFEQDIRALKAAGIVVVFAAGNDGPSPSTSNSPGNNASVISVGAMDQSNAIARHTSRGPSGCTGAPFPALLAPGVNVRTADISYGGHASYTMVSGSSMAAPHVAGVLALLAGAYPSASVAELETALLTGAKQGTGGDYPRLDALAAFNALSAIKR